MHAEGGYDIKGSIAHATMLGATGIIDKNESDKIIAELDHILSDIKNGSLTIDMEAEDKQCFHHKVCMVK